MKRVVRAFIAAPLVAGAFATVAAPAHAGFSAGPADGSVELKNLVCDAQTKDECPN